MSSHNHRGKFRFTVSASNVSSLWTTHGRTPQWESVPCPRECCCQTSYVIRCVGMTSKPLLHLIPYMEERPGETVGRGSLWMLFCWVTRCTTDEGMVVCCPAASQHRPNDDWCHNLVSVSKAEFPWTTTSGVGLHAVTPPHTITEPSSGWFLSITQAWA